MSAKTRFTKKQKKMLLRIIVSLFLFAAIFITDKTVNLAAVFQVKAGWVFPFLLYLSVYIIIGYDVLYKAARNIARGQIFDENFLMCVATIGAFALAVYNGVIGRETEGFDEACAVLLLYQTGEFFQSYAAARSRKSISELMDIRPDYANVKRDGNVVTVDPSEVAVGETIIVAPGEKIPLDGIISNGETSLDCKALTGEWAPAEVKAGDSVLSGSVNLATTIEITVSKAFYDSAVSKILNLVENASSKKSKAENFITVFSKYYTPAVCAIALMLAVIPPLIAGGWNVWIYRALSFLVVSCPCALVISVPLTFFSGIGAASKRGILIKGSEYLEKLNKANIFVFDKTGTLTKGTFTVTDVYPKENEEEILRLAAVAERDSVHPIAISIVQKYGGQADENYTLTNLAGLGIVAKNEKNEILCGNEKLMNKFGVEFEKATGGTVVYVALNGKFAGRISIDDEIKPQAHEVITQLNNMNCKTYMLTGDNEQSARIVAQKAGLTGYRASLLPQDKVEEAEKMLAQKGKNDCLCYTGDGINDAPVLMRSDIGIAMGGVGSDAAIEAADVVLMKDDLSGITLAKKIAKKTMSIVKQNIIFSLFVKLAILFLAAFGIADMWLSVFGDVGVAFIAILNAFRVK